jgi:hypothetical protein
LKALEFFNLSSFKNVKCHLSILKFTAKCLHPDYIHLNIFKYLIKNMAPKKKAHGMMMRMPPLPSDDETESEEEDLSDSGEEIEEDSSTGREPPGQEVELGPAPRAPPTERWWWRGNGAGVIAAGWHHSVVLNGDGSVSVFGNNDSGQLGVNLGRGRKNAFSPVKIPDIKYATCVAAGGHHTAIVTAEGKVLTFGHGRLAQLGYNVDSQGEPREVPGIQTAIGVSCGSNFTMVLLRNGHVVAFGGNGRENLLGTNTHETFVRVPSPVDLPCRVVAVACGDYHSLFLLDDGRVAAVGANNNGQLGLVGDYENKAVPVILPFVNVVSIFAWARSSAIIFTDERFMLFRRNILEFPRIHDALAISGNQSFVIVRSNGHVLTEDKYGQPVDKNWFRNAIAVSCGGSHTLIKHADGQVSAYGYGDQGQLGNGLPIIYGQRGPMIVPGIGTF